MLNYINLKICHFDYRHFIRQNAYFWAIWPKVSWYYSSVSDFVAIPIFHPHIPITILSHSGCLHTTSWQKISQQQACINWMSIVIMGMENGFDNEVQDWAYIYIYIFVMSLLRVCLPACVRNKTHFATPPIDMRYLVWTVSAKKMIHEKKSRFARTGRPQRAKACYYHYISCLKTTFYSFGPIK